MKEAGILLCVVLICASVPAGPQEISYQGMSGPNLMFSFDKKYMVDDFYVSPDGRKVATGWFWLSELPGRHTAIIDGQRYTSDVYELVEKGGLIGSLVSGAIQSAIHLPRTPAVTGLVFSPNSKSVAFRLDKGKDQLVVLNGAEGQPYRSVRYLTFSPDSKHLAYAAQVKGGYVVVLDGQEGVMVEEVTPPVFSPDSGRLAYAALRKRNEWVVVVDGKESAPFKEMGYESRLYFSQGHIGGPELEFIPGTKTPLYEPPSIRMAFPNPAIVFSPDSKRVAWVGRNKNKVFAVVDDLAGKEYDEIGHELSAAEADLAGLGLLAVPTSSYLSKYTPVFLSDSRHIAFSATLAKKSRTVVDGEEQAAGKISFSRDGWEFNTTDYFLKQTTEGFVLVQNDADKATYADVAVTAQSADRQHEAFAAKKGKVWKIVLDGVESEADYEKVESLQFAPAGNTLIASARKDKKWSVILEGVPGAAYRDVKDIVVSPDGRKVAFLAKTDKQWVLVTPDQGEKAYDEVRERLFSPEGGRFAFVARKDNKKWVVVLDGTEGQPYDEVRDLAFSPDGRHAVYAAKTGDNWAAVIDGMESPEKFDALISLQFSPNMKHTFVFEGPSRFFYYGRRLNDPKGVKDYFIIENDLR